ncbi:IS3 family transposase [Escherichia coli]|uniref:IS3 family transposase n=1 Tax=Escherichia coli TaxID=562 RepID=UPI000B7BD05E|nr:IS3 family transposase [Escherichia coli]ASN99461.1 hypothetical protein DS1UA2014_02315 [Escherichia coli]
MTKTVSTSKKPRKQHSPEFRSEALKLAERIGVTAAARELSLYESQLYNWRSKQQNQQTSSERELEMSTLRGSMSAKGCCYDNACVESFFHSLKVECIHGEHFISREIMRATVFNYIECDYNRWRRHSWCGGLSPEQFENKNLA